MTIINLVPDFSKDDVGCKNAKIFSISNGLCIFNSPKCVGLSTHRYFILCRKEQEPFLKLKFNANDRKSF